MKKTTSLFLVLFGATLATVTPSVVLAQQPPQIVHPPVSLVVNSNATAHFVVKATGSALKYQWQLDGVNIENATKAVLTLTNIAPIDAGVYQVTISKEPPRFPEAALSIVAARRESALTSSLRARE